MYLSPSGCPVDRLSALTVFSGPWEVGVSAAGLGCYLVTLREVTFPLVLGASGTRSGKGGVRL